MAAEGESANQVEDGGGFNFEEWSKSLKLSRKVTQILRNEELVTEEALKLVDTRDLKELGLPLGSIKLIIEDMKTPNKCESVCNSRDSNTEILAEAGKSLDLLLGGNSDNVCSSAQNMHMDPRTILTMKATTRKAVHITQFLTEKSKRRRQSRRREFVIRTGQSAETLLLKTDEEHPYLGINLEEWGAANMRLMNQLLSSGDLNRRDIEYYLAYTTRVFEFVDIYEWSSVLHFDYSYREQQAEHGFQWGTFSPHMELQLLIPKRSRQTGDSSSRQVSHTEEDCRIFKVKGTCPFGSNCRYRHTKQQLKTTTTLPQGKHAPEDM